MTAILIADTVLFTLLFLIWTTKNWPNLIIKLVFFGTAITNGFFVLQNAGYIIKL